jgi:hypothetical protein
MAPPFLSSSLDRGELSLSHPFHFTPVDISPGTNYIGTCLDGQEKIFCPYKEPNSLVILLIAYLVHVCIIIPVSGELISTFF